MYVFPKIYNGKIRLKIEYFSLKIGLNKPSFCQDIDNFWLKFINNKY